MSKTVFPIADNVRTGQKGMTLREYFAAQAMNGMNANHKYVDNAWSELAEKAVLQADLLILELNATPPAPSGDRRSKV